MQVMKWPPDSPGLNRIKHYWRRLKEKLHQHFPNIHKTKRGPETIRKHVAEALDHV